MKGGGAIGGGKGGRIGGKSGKEAEWHNGKVVDCTLQKWQSVRNEERQSKIGRKTKEEWCSEETK